MFPVRATESMVEGLMCKVRSLERGTRIEALDR